MIKDDAPDRTSASIFSEQRISHSRWAPGRRPNGGDQAFFRRPVATVAGSVADFSFVSRPPDTGRSNALWRRSGAALARLLALAPFAAGGSCTRLRFRAAIRSMTGAGVEISGGLIGNPFILALIRPKSSVPCPTNSSYSRRPLFAAQNIGQGTDLKSSSGLHPGLTVR